jgi:hypothetical protein
MKRSGFLRIPIGASRLTVKLRKCKVKACRKQFVPAKPFIEWCSDDCAHALALEKLAKIKERAAKAERKADKAKREKLKSRADWMREAQAAVNAWVRERDRDLPCISCGRHHKGQYHAGHYLARGSHPHLALVENNLAKQCAPCNTYLSGNQLNFRIGLIARIGLEAVEALEADNTVRKWSIAELQEIKALYKRKLKELKESVDASR